MPLVVVAAPAFALSNSSALIEPYASAMVLVYYLFAEVGFCLLCCQAWNCLALKYQEFQCTFELSFPWTITRINKLTALVCNNKEIQMPEYLHTLLQLYISFNWNFIQFNQFCHQHSNQIIKIFICDSVPSTSTSFQNCNLPIWAKKKRKEMCSYQNFATDFCQETIR